jgi:hypothetical protein
MIKDIIIQSKMRSCAGVLRWVNPTEAYTLYVEAAASIAAAEVV